MFSISFIFKPGTYDDEFHRLDDATQAVADGTEGFLGSETWWSDDRTVRVLEHGMGIRVFRNGFGYDLRSYFTEPGA